MWEPAFKVQKTVHNVPPLWILGCEFESQCFPGKFFNIMNLLITTNYIGFWLLLLQNSDEHPCNSVLPHISLYFLDANAMWPSWCFILFSLFYIYSFFIHLFLHHGHSLPSLLSSQSLPPTPPLFPAPNPLLFFFCLGRDRSPMSIN